VRAREKYSATENNRAVVIIGLHGGSHQFELVVEVSLFYA
jgi:hypothetical protein